VSKKGGITIRPFYNYFSMIRKKKVSLSTRVCEGEREKSRPAGKNTILIYQERVLVGEFPFTREKTFGGGLLGEAGKLQSSIQSGIQGIG